MKSKKSIKDIITSLNKQPVLFIGSGFSKRYLGLENWEELLKKFISDISNDEFKYEMYASKISEEDYYGKQAAIAKLLEEITMKLFLIILSLIILKLKIKIL